MPIIKDKYSAKGSQTRSKFVVRKQSEEQSTQIQSQISTQQREAENANTYRRENKISTGQISNNQISTGNIGSARLLANKAILSFTLQKGHTLRTIAINNYNASSTSNVISMHWTLETPDNADVSDVSSGLIESSRSTTRLFTANFPYLATISLQDLISNMFVNVDKTVYFYATANLEGPELTFSSTSGGNI